MNTIEEIWIDHNEIFYFSKTVLKNESEMMDTSLKRIDADFHFFSDTELTNNGNIDVRSGAPINIESVLSDSEIEVKVRKGEFT